MSASRSTGGYGDGVVDAKITAPQIPRIVWMLWFQGWDRAPYVCKNCKSLGNWTSLHGERWWKIMNYDDDPSDPLDSTQVSYNLQCVKWQWLSVRFLSLSSESLNWMCFRNSIVKTEVSGEDFCIETLAIVVTLLGQDYFMYCIVTHFTKRCYHLNYKTHIERGRWFWSHHHPVKPRIMQWSPCSSKASKTFSNA